MVAFESELDTGEVFRSNLLSDLYPFKGVADVLVANRNTEYMRDVVKNIFPRFPFGDN